ncbi:uncharacterized protein [Montipora foliosa]|uniref:uncharacterized protein n=1 Tax=Montipora foliosa TaxID=591990 RepID=UPI0035F1AAB9
MIALSVAKLKTFTPESEISFGIKQKEKRFCGKFGSSSKLRDTRKGGNYCSIEIIVSSLTALMMDQVEEVKKQGESTAIIQAECLEADNCNELEINVHGDSLENVLRGRVSILFSHPEVLVGSNKCGVFPIGCASNRRSLCCGRLSALHRGLASCA